MERLLRRVRNEEEVENHSLYSNLDRLLHQDETRVASDEGQHQLFEWELETMNELK